MQRCCSQHQVRGSAPGLEQLLPLLIRPCCPLDAQLPVAGLPVAGLPVAGLPHSMVAGIVSSIQESEPSRSCSAFYAQAWKLPSITSTRQAVSDKSGQSQKLIQVQGEETQTLNRGQKWQALEGPAGGDYHGGHLSNIKPGLWGPCVQWLQTAASSVVYVVCCLWRLP